MKNRVFILELLEKYKGSDQLEESLCKETIEFVQSNEECFDNNYKPGHITGSALVVDRKRKSALLTHHSVLDMWIQFGGHSDGHWNPLDVAWREAHEESGLNTLAYIPKYEGVFDVDIHCIPAGKSMPEHKHYDIRILLTADKNEPYMVTHESHNLKWLHLDEVSQYNADEGFLRLVNKVKNNPSL